MIIKRKSILTGVEREREMPTVTEERLVEWRGANGHPGKPIQTVFPELNDDDREFIMTGIVTSEWDDMKIGKKKF